MLEFFKYLMGWELGFNRLYSLFVFSIMYSKNHVRFHPSRYLLFGRKKLSEVFPESL